MVLCSNENSLVHPMKSSVILKGFSAVLPPYHRPQEEGFEWLVDAHARAAATFEGREASLEKWRARISRMVRRYNCAAEHIGRRRSDLEDFMHTDWQRMEIFNLLESPQGKGLGARNRFYAETASRVVEELFAGDIEPPLDLLHVSCTGYASPSPIQRLIGLKRWHNRTLATQVYHMGCYAAVPALRIAAGLLQCPPRNGERRAEIVHTELCTLHFNPLDHSPEQLIVQSLFADGHIRYAMVPRDTAQEDHGAAALELLSVREEMVPDSLDDMAWVLSDWGFRMTLSRDVPGKVAAYAGLAIFSCLFVTKDERVHLGHCCAAEQWLHALLFTLHPLVLLSAGLLWPAAHGIRNACPGWIGYAGDERALLTAFCALVFGFGMFQFIYWNLL